MWDIAQAPLDDFLSGLDGIIDDVKKYIEPFKPFFCDVKLSTCVSNKYNNQINIMNKKTILLSYFSYAD